MAELPHLTIVAHDVGHVGGMERQLAALIDGLLDRGGTVTVVSRSCELQAREGLEWIRIRTPARPFPVAFVAFAIVAGIRLGRIRRGGLVQTTGAIVVSKVDVVELHLCHAGIRRATSVVRQSRPGPLYRLNARLASALSVTAERWCLRPGRVRAVTVVSEGLGREVAEIYPGIAEAVTVVPNGVDLERFSPSEQLAGEGSQRHELRAVFVGSEWEGKRLGVAIEAVARVPGWTLEVVGRGDVSRFRAIASEHGVDHRVSFLGVREDVAEILRGADALILPSAYETFSLVAFEAAACGVPLVATAVHGVEEILRDGWTGFVVDGGADTVVSALVRLGSLAPAERALMGRRAREAASAYTWDRCVAAHAQLYERLSCAS